MRRVFLRATPKKQEEEDEEIEKRPVGQQNNKDEEEGEREQGDLAQLGAPFHRGVCSRVLSPARKKKRRRWR